MAGVALVAGIGLLAAVAEHSGPLAGRHLLDRLQLDEEASIPTLVSTGMLAVGAAGAALVGWARSREGGREARGWAALCAVLVIFTLDEHLAMHETLIQPLRDLLDVGGLLHFTWIVPGTILAVVLMVALARFQTRLDPRVGASLTLAAALFFIGALGFEAIGGLYASSRGEGGLGFELLTCVEEILELLGAAVLLYALATAVALQGANLRVTAGAVDRRPVLRAGVIAVACLAFLSLAAMLADVLVLEGSLDPATSRLDVATERSIPTLFSALLFLAAAALFAVIGMGERRAGGGGERYWLFLALLFAGLAVDERVEVHEALTQPVRELLGVGGGLLEYAWIVPGALAVALLGLVYARFLTALPRRTLRRLCVAAAVFLAGAIGVEALGGWWAAGGGKDNVVYVLLTTVEEMLEMLGLVLLVDALLRHARDELPEMELGILPSANDVASARRRRSRQAAVTPRPGT